ncbi:MAG: DegV family protein [Chloroflexi bacterium]|nr:DegV family protein [Chloroflexota bacterium]
MAQVGIVTDSLACMPRELAREHSVGIAAVSISINGKSYLDEVDITSDEFWKMFNSNAIKQFSTGAVGPGEFVRAFTEVAKTTDSIACVVVSKVLSATHQAATEASETVKRNSPGLNIEIIDSKAVGGVETFAVLEAVRAARAGKSLAEVVQIAQDVISRGKLFFSLETLKYLIKSGRAPKVAWVGEMVQVKPIVGFTNGSGVLEQLARVRTRHKAIEKMVDMVGQYGDTSKPLHLMVHYTDSREAGEELKNQVCSRYKCAEVYISPFTPAMSGHTGPVLGLGFYS